jgi:hypothetical protein
MLDDPPTIESAVAGIVVHRGAVRQSAQWMIER